jgi:phosphatidylserine decarboxylase
MSPIVLLQYLVPQRALSRLAHCAARITWAPWKNRLIGTIVRRYRIDLSDAAQPDPQAYPHFAAFFTRALRPSARPQPTDPAAIACPADGRISQLGRLVERRALQAKGRDFTIDELLADASAAAPYTNGLFLTVYLSPRDYHRVHMPLAGRLRETVHVPGRLFSVAPRCVRSIPRLFARNERLICHFDGAHGPFAVVLVGAMLVSGIETVWGGVEVPPYARVPMRRDWRASSVVLARGAELGRFHFGSTVILLLPEGVAELDPALGAESPVRMGQRVGWLRAERTG